MGPSHVDSDAHGRGKFRSSDWCRSLFYMPQRKMLCTRKMFVLIPVCMVVPATAHEGTKILRTQCLSQKVFVVFRCDPKDRGSRNCPRRHQNWGVPKFPPLLFVGHTIDTGSRDHMMCLYLQELSLSGPKESAVCPLRNSQLVLVTMDETMTGQAVHRVVDAGAVVAGSWDVLVCGNDADLHGDTRTPVAQRFLNDGGILCGATCWVRFEKKEAVDTSALKVEVLGSDAFGSGVARADAEYVIDCRADVGAASALMKDIMAAKQSPTVVCLVPYDEAQTGGVLAVKDRALALRGWCRCARNETGLDVLSLQVRCSRA